jgi:uncharacterized protein YjbI with pentapeptide repeats
MANEEHLEILKKGPKKWNLWREKNPDVRPDLTGVALSEDLYEVNLNEINLSGADLRGANLIEEDLSNAKLARADLTATYLSGANLRGADLLGAYLSEANLFGTNLLGANLSGANLRGADLLLANLIRTNLTGANLSNANLFGVNLLGADLREANFTASTMSATTVVDVDLSAATGLETITHRGPSSIGIDTIYKSQGNIPEIFLRGAGVPETFIAYAKSLVVEPIEYYSCFISYSNKDEEFTKRLHRDLQGEGVRCWFDREDLKIGDEIRPKIDEAIRKYDKLLIVLTENSVGSPWVRREVESAFAKEVKFEIEERKRPKLERKQRRTVLFPIRLDDEVMETEEAWAADLRRMRHIGDFRKWKEHDDYKKAFERLMRDLKA